MEFFEIKIKRITHEGDDEKVLKEAYLVEACSYTEAETRFAQFMAKLHAEDAYTVLKISATKFSQLAREEGVETEDPFFKVKILSYYKKEGSERLRHHTLVALIHAKTPMAAAAEADRIGDEQSAEGHDVVRIEKTRLVAVVIPQRKADASVE